MTSKQQKNSDDIYTRPEELLRQLVRFDTTNPPGNEEACVRFIGGLLEEAGLEPTYLSKVPKRPNLVARLPGQGLAPPLMLYGHVDVVPTTNQDWRYPPFEATRAEGFIWGRGTMDMKGGVAMILAAVLRAKAEGLKPAGDLVVVILSDEEAAGTVGAKYLTEEHPGLFKGIQYAIGEAGGSTLHLAGRRFYPIQIAEKQLCWMKATVKGPGGHGARTLRGGAMAKAGRLLTALDTNRLPVHITTPTKLMIEQMSAHMAYPTDSTLRLLLDPDMTDSMLDQMGQEASFLDPLLHNTTNATIIQGGHKINVIPSEVVVEIDGRLLPGFRPEDLFGELSQIVGDDVELTLVRHDPGPSEPDMSFYEPLAAILEEADPGGAAVPWMLSGVTDGRFFSRLGIQTYGFTPMKLPAGFDGTKMAHAADERIPIGAVEFGTEAIYKAIVRYQ